MNGKDLAGNSAVTAIRLNVTFDTTPPIITNVTSSTANGSYKQGDTVNVTVNFSENVTLSGGSLIVTLDTGGIVTIAPFDNANTASGTYTVGVGHTTADLTASSPLSLSTGTLRDAALNSAVLTIPAGQNIANLKDIIIDTAAPTITSVNSSTLDGSYKQGDTVNVTVNFSENVTLTGGNLIVTLNTGGTATISPFTNANTASGTYTVGEGQTTSDLTAASPLTLSAGTLRDAALNSAVLAIPGGQNIADSKDIIIDTTVPTITSVTSSTSNGTYKPGDAINVTVNFSENVTLAGGSLIVTLNTGGTATIAPFANSNTASGTYTVGAGQTTSDLTAASPLTLSGGTLVDAALNSAALAIPGGQNIADSKDIAIDTTAPTVTAVSVSSLADANAGTVNVTLTFSEAMDSATNPAQAITGLARVYSITGSAWTEGNTKWTGSFTFVDDGEEAAGIYGISGFKDAAGNTMAADTSYNVTVDTKNPVFSNLWPSAGSSISSPKISYTPTENLASATVTWTRTSGSADGSSPHVKTLVGTELLGIEHSSITISTPPVLVSGAVYTISWAGYDYAGNISQAASVANIAFDTTKPTILNIAANGADVGLSTTYLDKADAGIVSVKIVFTMTMKTSVNPSPALAGLAGGSYAITGSSWSTTTLSNDTWTGTFTFVDNNEEATGNFNVSGFANIADVYMDANNSFTVKADTKSPVYTVTGPASSSYVNTSEVSYSLSENLGTGTITWTRTGGTADGSSPHLKTLSAADRTSGAHNNTILASPPVLVSGSIYTLAFSGNDLVGNPALVVTRTDVAFDNTAPTITSVTSSAANGSYKQGDTLNVTVNFSEIVTLSGGNLVVTLNTGGTATITPFGPSNTASGTYTVGAGQTTSDLTASSPLSLSTGTLRDAALNNANLAIPGGSNIADLKDIVIDTAAPVITSVTSSTANGSYKQGDTVNVTVNFSENVTLSGGSLVVALNTGGTATVSPFTNANTAGGTYTVGSGHTTSDLTAMTPLTLSGGTLRDAALNSAVLAIPAGQNIADLKDIVIDTTAPTVVSITSSTSNGTYGPSANINVTVTLSEPVTLSIGTLNVTLDTGAVISVTGSYPASVLTGVYTVQAGHASPDLESTGITLNGGALLADAAGNSAVVSLPGTTIAVNSAIVIDAQKPTIVSAVTVDSNGNGKIDHYRITFSENIIDSTFPGYALNSLGAVQTAWLVAGYSNVRLAHGSAAPYSDTVNDNVIYIKFDEKALYDTGAMPDLTTTASPAVADSVGNVIDQIIMDSVIETDGAPPVIISASGVTGSNILTINFSEPVDSNGSAGGSCDAPLAAAAFVYTNTSGNGAASITGMGTDTNGCDDNKVTLLLNIPLEAGDINVDNINAAASAIKDVYDNSAGTGLKIVTGAISPYILGVTATGPRKIRVTYSEPVDETTGATGAMNLANYTLIEDPVQSGCGGTGSDVISLTGAVTKITNSVFELATNADQCSVTTYRVTVSNVIDINDGVPIANPKFGNFLGNERLKVAAAACLTDATLLVTFNKDVKSGSGSGGSETTTRYKLTGATSLGTISSALRGSVQLGQVTITHTLLQTGATYTVIGSNATNGDGFDDAALGAIEVDASTETLQAAPRDRYPFSGCGQEIVTFEQGPISSDPFGDSTDFGYLTSYNSKVYIGPNNKGNAATRLDPDGANPAPVYFEFVKDITGDTASNSAATREGGVAVPPYVTIGHSGCTANNATMNLGCGPDNENGRGLFNTGTINGTKYIFLGGARTAENFDYVYYSADNDDTLNFNYIDLGTITGTVTAGIQSMAVKDNRLFAGMAKRNNTDALNTPDFGYVTFNTADATYCTSGSSCDATDGTRGRRLYIQHIDYFGGDYLNPYENYAYYNGVDSLVVFRNYIYAANGGHNFFNRDGAIIRSSTTGLPAQCTYGIPGCAEWTDVTPRDTYRSGASVNVTFHASTRMDVNDYIYVMDLNGNNIAGSPFTGTTLAGTTITVPGTGFKIRLTSDGAGTNRWGFEVTNVTLTGFTGTAYDTYPVSAHNYVNNSNIMWGYAVMPTTAPMLWTNGGSRYSVELPSYYDLIPGDRAFSQFVEFNGNLYVTRTACKTTGTNARDTALHVITGCNDGTDANREAQLWKCVPGTTGNIDACDAGDWTLVDGISSVTNGVTNFGDATNRTLSMAVVNGAYLYVGFDNQNGIEIWRTKAGVTNPASEDDFEQVASDGLGNPTLMKEIYSAISIQQGASYYLYISAGYNATPVQVFRNVD